MQLFFGGFFWHRSAFQFLVYFDVLAHFFFGFFVDLAHPFGFTSGRGQVADAKSYDHCPTYSDDCVHFLSLIKAVIRTCMARAHDGCGKFHPTNAPAAIQNMMSNMVNLLKFLGVVVATAHQKQVLMQAWQLVLQMQVPVHQRLVWMQQVRRMRKKVWVVRCRRCWLQTFFLVFYHMRRYPTQHPWLNGTNPHPEVSMVAIDW
jgi:hypothetical protein